MTIYLINAASVAAVERARAANKTPKPELVASVGPGPVFSIMRFPRWEKCESGSGRVAALTPPAAFAPRVDAKAAASRAGDVPELREWRAYEDILRGRWLAPEYVRRCAPGALWWGEELYMSTDGVPWDGSYWSQRGDVPDGATLICACSREAAAMGRCHRVIAADVLRVAGWRVILDGREVEA